MAQIKKTTLSERRELIKQQIKIAPNLSSRAEMFYGHEKDFGSFDEFKKAIDEYIDYYNNTRIQSKTKWMPSVIYRKTSIKSA